MPTHMPMLVCTHRSTHTCIYTSLYVSVYICQRTRPCTCLCTQMIYLFMHYALSNVPVTMKTSPAIVYKRPCDCARAVQEPNPRRDLVSTIACTCGRAARTAARAARGIERCLCHWRTVLPNGLLSRGSVCVHVHAHVIASELTSTKMLPAFGILVISISVILVMAAYQSRHYVSSDSIRHMGYEHIGYVGYKSISVMIVPKAFGSVFSKLARTTYQFR